jgi:tetratricopeptide (TPR) repeat protein
MSQKQNKKNGPASNAVPNVGGAHLLQEEIERVRELIAGRHSKSALQLAKDLFKRSSTAESEALLIDAYKVRIDDLLKLGMTVEAKTLLGIVRERFPSALPRMTELGREICAQDGKLEEVVAPLADRELPAEVRDRIETFIRQRIWDLPTLGAVSSLPQEHSLRRAASALAAAFEAVTKGPVEDAVLELPEVSRRSPLGSWKALIRAIACYHRCEDAECRRWLQTIPIDSVPARLLPVFAVMLKMKSASGTDPKCSLAGQKLIAAAGDHVATLRSALTDLEDALQAKKQKRFLDAVRTAMAASKYCSAVTRERLRQHISVRSGSLDIQQSAVDAAVGGSPRSDAYYFRLLARSLEDQHILDNYAEAVSTWADFRREALKERWFAPGGLEDGVLALHMAQLVEKVPSEIIEELRREMATYRKPGQWKQDDGGVPSAKNLYERACKADPHSEAFQAWLSWARKHETWQEADRVAERWREAQTTDIQPLLYLMESAEKRDAFKKSLKYLEEAEDLDRLNPAVRRARLRLLLAAALRHLQQRKAHLALGGIEQIETVPEVRPGEIAALAAALRWCTAAMGGDKAVQDEQQAGLNTLLGNVAAHLLKAAVADKADMGSTASMKAFEVARVPAAELLGGVARARALGEWAGLRIALPHHWNDPLIAALKSPNCPADVAQMLLLGEAALDGCSEEVGYAVSAAGLAKGGANAEFLFLRARSLPLWASLRREGCITASLELARRDRNTGLAGRILDHLNGKTENERKRWRPESEMGGDPAIASRAVSPELLGKILEEEQTLQQFPGYNIDQEPKYAEELGDSSCDCPNCRARRGEPVEEGEFFYEDDEDDFDEGDDFDEDEEGFDGAPPPPLKQMAEQIKQLLGSLPPPLALAMAKRLNNAIDAGQSPIDAIQTIMSLAMPTPGSPASSQNNKKLKAAKLPPPEQGSLF